MDLTAGSCRTGDVGALRNRSGPGGRGTTAGGEIGSTTSGSRGFTSGMAGANATAGRGNGFSGSGSGDTGFALGAGGSDIAAAGFGGTGLRVCAGGSGAAGADRGLAKSSSSSGCGFGTGGGFGSGAAFGGASIGWEISSGARALYGMGMMADRKGASSAWIGISFSQFSSARDATS